MKPTTKQILDTIAGRLWDGHACLFVGAGFSKNATLLTGATTPPNWNELGDLFFERARTHKPTPKEREYANVLRLAEEVECVSGRQTLSQLIQDAIHDDKLEPSDLHIQLLSLPWRDVFTTNYDTLLERAADKLNKQGKTVYSIISNDEEIGIKSPPFIMKLHGDIRSPKSIVITEEDYRKYPSFHQAMIGYIRHSIMMETLVLIGFSGNDPNFIQWLGWVKDALSENQRKVYLLTVDDISESMVKTFEKKHVIVVDLRDFAGKGSKVQENIEAAIEYLNISHRKRVEEGRLYKKQVLEWGRTTVHDEDLDITLNRWKKERESYPGWLVMPREKRELWASVEGFFLPKDKLNRLKSPDDILFLDLFNWRIEKSMFPIDNAWETVYLSVLDKYKPFGRRTRGDIKDAWINLKLGLLRLYRQEQWVSKWDSLNEELSSVKEHLSSEHRCRLAYEQALLAIYRNDFKRLEEILNDWPKQRKDPYWDVRRGALWAEYLSLDFGAKMTKRAFDIICEKLESAENERDRYYWGSRKVHAHTVLNCMAQANFSENKAVTDEARKTWLELRPYDDIWYEREFFDAHLRPIELVAQVTTKEASFSLGRSRSSTKLDGNSKDYRIAYAFFLFYEETAFPIHLPYLNAVEKTTLDKALSVMAYCSPAIAETWLLRSGDSKIVSSVFNRRYLDRIPFKDVAATYERYLGIFESLLKEDKGDHVPSWVIVFRNILPEILSRLCMKASYDAREKTFYLIDQVFEDRNSMQYEGMDKLLSSLILSLSKSQIEGILPMIIQMNTAVDRFGEYQLEPLSYLEDPCNYIFTVPPGSVEGLFNRIGQNEASDKLLIYRLMFLQRAGVLNPQEQKRLTALVWARTDQYGFPIGTAFAKFFFLTQPHPDNVNPHALLKSYFEKSKLPRMGKGAPVSIYGGHIALLNEIKGTFNEDVEFTWDAEMVNDLCKDIVGLWESDKWRLKETEQSLGFSVKEEFERRIKEIENILSGVVAQNSKLVNGSNRKALAKMICEFEDYGLPALRVKVALDEFLDSPVDLAQEIPRRLGSADEAVVNDCIKTISYLNKHGNNVMKWIELLSEYFRSFPMQGRDYYNSWMEFFTENTECLDNETIRENLIIGLERLFGETQIVLTDSELDANVKMYQRMLVAPIVRRLVERKDDPDNEILMRCRDYYESDDTCWDVRNKYYE